MTPRTKGRTVYSHDALPGSPADATDDSGCCCDPGLPYPAKARSRRRSSGASTGP